MATKKKQHTNPFMKVKVTEDAVSLYNNGVALKVAGHLEAAVEKYQEAIKLKPDFVEAHYNKGNALRELRQFSKAIDDFNIAINIKPDFSLAFFNRGNIYKEIGEFELALNDYDSAIQFNPYYYEAYSNKGLTLVELRKFSFAIDCYDKAILLNSNLAEAYSNKGNLLKDLNEIEAALVHHDKAIEINPFISDYHINKGIALIRANKLEEALGAFADAKKIKPDSKWLLGLILHTQIFLCHWEKFSENIVLCEEELRNNKPVIPSFMAAMLYDDPKLQQLASIIYTKERFPLNDKTRDFPNRNFNEKLKLGYFSTDFYYHPVSIWLVEQLENCDKSKFELFAFCLNDQPDPMQERLKAAFDHWIVVEDMSDLEIVSLSRELKIDIALDLNGHTQTCRTSIFSNRAAPIQMSFLGMPGTMGAEYIDYLLSDRPTITQDNLAFMTEKVVYLPCGYTYDRQRRISDEPLSRQQYGLPKTGFVFTCQNGCHKFTPKVFAIWMEILKAVPGSVLWLLKPNQTAERNLQSAAKAQGVDSDRLIFTARESVTSDQESARIGRYLATYKLADLFLDTWPYNAGTTAVDALWAGLPVLTKAGESIISRMTVSSLCAISLPELITATEQDYQEMAIELASNPEKLYLLKVKLKRNRMASALFDPVANTRHIENAFLEIHQYHHSVHSDV
jgi:predicted O-linked N-acetylglucosamine transferase (SPINDLY family)